MVADDLVSVLRNNMYAPMNTNIQNVWFFSKIRDEDMDIISVVNNCNGIAINGDDLDSIAFQVERKFLLNGRKNVNIQYIILSDNVERDRHIADEKNINFWIIDVKTDRLLVYENSGIGFENFRQELETAIKKDLESRPKKKVNISYVNFIMVLINVIVFAILEINGSTNDSEYMLKWGASQWQLIFKEGQYYRLVTCMFLHFGLAHLCSNMFSLIIIGNEVEKIFGKVKYLIIYFTSGIGASIVSALYYMKRNEPVVSAGASGAIFGIIGAMLVGMYITNRLRGPGVGRKFLLMLLMAMYSGSVNVDNMAHVGGFVTGVIVAALLSGVKARFIKVKGSEY